MHVALLELIETGKPSLSANSAQSVGLHKTPVVGNGGRCGLKRHLPMTRLQTVGRTVLLHHQGVSELAPAVADAKGSVIPNLVIASMPMPVTETMMAIGFSVWVLLTLIGVWGCLARVR